MKEKKTLALARMITALVLAALLAGLMGTALGALLRGPEPVEDAENLAESAYVRVEAGFVMDVIAVEKNSAGEAVAYYAVSPIGNTFGVARYPAADLESIIAMEEATRSFLQGETEMDIYITVTGTVEPMDETVSELFVEWFEENEDWMTVSGVIGATEDYSSYLSPLVIDASRIGPRDRTAALVCSLLIVLLVVYAAVEAVLVTRGVYNRPQKKAKPAPAAPAPIEASPAPGPESEPEERPEDA